MQLAVLDALAGAHEALIRALDGDDLAEIERATAALAEAVHDARDHEWRSAPELRERLLSLAALAQAAQIRVNFLTDMIRRRVDAAAALRGAQPAAVYHAHAR
jgi:alkylhydroperoxidase/carboxymuconolactone decarboxylase family protein YurZ